MKNPDKRQGLKRKLYYSVLILILASTFTCPALSFPYYRIVLKNGSSIIVESYKRVDGKIQFFKSGGMMEIDSADIMEIKEIGTIYREEKEPPAEEPSPLTSPTIKEESDEEIKLRIEEIQREKELLKKEADEINQEIEKLNREIRREGRLLAIRKKRQLEKEKGELEKRVNELNNRIEELNREESELLRKLWKY